MFVPDRIRAAALAVLALAILPLPLSAQDPAALSLTEAIELARANNPDFLAVANDEHEADWRVREALGALLPSANVSAGFGYQAEGQPRFGVVAFEETPATYFSDYNVGLNLTLNTSTLFRPTYERTTRRAVVARTEAAAFVLEAEVTGRYLAVRRAQDAVDLAAQELERAKENQRLAEARVAVGAAIPLESKQAELQAAQAEVALLQAQNTLEAEGLRLMQQLGVEFDGDLRLTTQFDVFDPPWTEPELTAAALEAHPQLRAAQATANATGAAVRMAMGQYLPTLSFSVGWQGFTQEAGDSDYLIRQAELGADNQIAQCQALNEILTRLADPLPTQDCNAFALSDSDRAEILAGNDAFPFSYTPQPLSAQLRVSLPIFQGFSRQRQIEQAQVAADDARHRLRAEELRLKTEIASALNTLETAYRTVLLQERGRTLGEEQLLLARERYRVGAASYLELTEAETQKARVDQQYLAGVYGFHEALAALEAAVGRSLRPATEE